MQKWSNTSQCPLQTWGSPVVFLHVAGVLIRGRVTWTISHPALSVASPWDLTICVCCAGERQWGGFYNHKGMSLPVLNCAVPNARPVLHSMTLASQTLTLTLTPLPLLAPPLLKALKTLFLCRVYTHHYAQYMDLSMFDHAAEVMNGITGQYAAIDTAVAPPPVTRMRPRGLSFL